MVFTVDEAAVELGYRPMTLYQKIREKKITVRRSGRALRIFEEDNAELFAERRAFLGEKQPARAARGQR